MVSYVVPSSPAPLASPTRTPRLAIPASGRRGYCPRGPCAGLSRHHRARAMPAFLGTRHRQPSPTRGAWDWPASSLVACRPQAKRATALVPTTASLRLREGRGCPPVIDMTVQTRSSRWESSPSSSRDIHQRRHLDVFPLVRGHGEEYKPHSNGFHARLVRASPCMARTAAGGFLSARGKRCRLAHGRARR
jgi:hypothetical protein